MSKQFFQVGAVAVVFILIACSSPKYTYKFDHYNYNSEKKTSPEKIFTHTEPVKEISPLLFSEKDLSASAFNRCSCFGRRKNFRILLAGRRGRSL